jgi:hypothetical protein
MKWRDIKKEPAPKGEFVLAYHKHCGMEVSRDFNYSFKDVTHWMPLPAKPDAYKCQCKEDIPVYRMEDKEICYKCQLEVK